MPDAGALISLAIAMIAGAFALASQRSAAKASKVNTQTVTAVDREKEAYERARAFDTETMQLQSTEIHRLREDNLNLHEEVAAAKREAQAAHAEAAAAHEEAAEARRESQEVRAENIRLRLALNDFMQHRDNNPHS